MISVEVVLPESARVGGQLECEPIVECSFEQVRGSGLRVRFKNEDFISLEEVKEIYGLGDRDVYVEYADLLSLRKTHFSSYIGWGATYEVCPFLNVNKWRGKASSSLTFYPLEDIDLRVLERMLKNHMAKRDANRVLEIEGLRELMKVMERLPS
jgi:hypothetical protein